MAVSLKERTEDEKRRLLEKLRAREIARCRASFSYFLFKYVLTKDEHDPKNPIKPFPDKAYLRFLADELEHGPSVQYVAKSRQLMVSWILCAYAVWKMLFFAHSAVFFQSKKEGDAADMIFNTTPQFARMSFIMVNLPEWLQVCVVHAGKDKDGNDIEQIVRFPTDQRTFTYGSVMLPNGSHCKALAQGAAQVEGKVPSLFLSDEASLQDEWSAAWAAVMPCISNGGQAISVATMRLPSAYGEEIATCAEVDPDSELRGVARFKTTSGGSGLRIHYSADPDKDPGTEIGAAWFTQETANMRGGYEGVDWKQHMEIDPTSRSGTRVLPMWESVKEQVVIDELPLELVRQWRLDSGFDWGLRNRTVWQIFANDYDGNRYMIYELAVPAGDMEAMRKAGTTRDGVLGMADLMKRHPLFSMVDHRIQADPSIWNKTQATKDQGVVSTAKLFADAGVHLTPAKLNGQEADDLWLSKLMAYWSGWEEKDFVPRLFICRGCKETIERIPALFYQDFTSATADKNSLKEKFVGARIDWQDAWKYAEAASPSRPALRLTPEAKMGSWTWYLDLVKKEAGRGKYVRS